jgi:thiosulfate/3-mercaptopyruvate sulfurtransferase
MTGSQPATRVVFTLDYAGLGAQTSLLDGGMQAYKRDGNALSNVKSALRTGTLSTLRIRPSGGRRSVGEVACEQSRHRRGGWTSSRILRWSSDRARHAQQPANRPYRGRESVPFTEITDENLKLRSREELAAIFLKAGVQPRDTVVGYCHIGQQATGMLFAARSLGHPVLPL